MIPQGGEMDKKTIPKRSKDGKHNNGSISTVGKEAPKPQRDNKSKPLYSTSTTSSSESDKQLNLEETDRLAEMAHFGQLDKIGVPYIEHPRAVARIVETVPSYSKLTLGNQWLSISVALLHDVIEDTPLSSADLINAGVRVEALFSIAALTKRNGLPLDDYYRGVVKDPVARVVKVADMAHNADPERLSMISDEQIRRRLEAKYSKGIKEITKDFPEDLEWFKARTGL